MTAYRHRIRSVGDLFHEDYIRVTAYGCWEWTGKRDRCGYGVFIKNGRQVRVARTVLESVSGEPLGELNALHRCDNPPCFRPDHLFRGSQKDNHDDAVAKGRKSQKKGRSGIPGIIWRKGRQKWSVMRYVNGRQKSYGDFYSFNDAVLLNAQLEQKGGESN